MMMAPPTPKVALTNSYCLIEWTAKKPIPFLWLSAGMTLNGSR